jgi:hypothetical protein
VQAKQQIKDFFKKTRKSVAKTQQNMVDVAMQELFDGPPHSGDPESPYSQSEYDANHKIQINHGLVSPHNPPTNNTGVSFALHYMEKEKADQIESGDRVAIFNTTLHNAAVEFGGATWGRPGYYVYTNTMRRLKERFSDVTK